MSHKKVRLPEENRIGGVFGESTAAYYLTKIGIHVLLVDTVFFDIIAKDISGKSLNTTKSVGISVKFRDRSWTTRSCTVPIPEFPKIKSMAEKWDVVPWFCYIIVFMENGKRMLEGFFFSAEDATAYMSEGKREFAISFSKLRQARVEGKIGKNCYFCWTLEGNEKDLEGKDSEHFQKCRVRHKYNHPKGGA